MDTAKTTARRCLDYSGLFALTLCVALLGGAPLDSLADSVTPDAEYDYLRWYCNVRESGFKLRVQGKMTLYSQRADEYQQLQIDENKFVKLKDVTIRVIDADGEEMYSLQKKDMVKSCGYSNSSLYEDVCMYLRTLESPTYPYSVEWEYTQDSKSLFFWNGADFQRSIPVRSATYELQIRPDVRFDYRVVGSGMEPVIDTQKKHITYVWHRDSLPAYEPTAFAPPGYDPPTGVSFAPDKLALKKYRLEGCTWTNIGKWYAKMASKKYLQKKESSNVSAGGSLWANAERAYEDVTNDIRYVAIQIGVGGWQPYAASLTQERGYGDCKDMTTLLISQLESAGIVSYPVLVRTKDMGPVDPGFPSLNFNHVITVSVSGADTLWMDPTCSDCPLGELPPGDEDIEALVVTDSGGEIWRTPSSSSADNKVSRTTRYFIGADLRGAFTSTLELSGNYAIETRNALARLDREGRRRAINASFTGAGKRFRIDSFTVADLDDNGQPIRIQIYATMNQRDRRIRRVVYCNPFLFDKLSPRERADVTEREAPLYMGYPYLKEDKITLVWDTALSVDSVVVPEDDSVFYAFGAFSHTLTRFPPGADSVIINITREQSTYAVEPHDFSNYVSYRDAVAKFVSGHLKLYLQSSQN